MTRQEFDEAILGLCDNLDHDQSKRQADDWYRRLQRRKVKTEELTEVIDRVCDVFRGRWPNYSDINQTIGQLRLEARDRQKSKEMQTEERGGGEPVNVSEICKQALATISRSN